MAFRAAGLWGVVLLAAVAVELHGCGESENRAKALRGPSAGEGGECAACEGGSSTGGAGGEAGAAPAAGGAAEPAGGSPEAGAGPAPGPDLTLRSITISQTLELTLMQGGVALPSEERSVPLIAGKRALLRAFVEPSADFRARELLGVLDLKSPSGADTMVSQQQITLSSLQEDLSSTFDFSIEARDLEAATEYRLRVLEANTEPLLRFPEAGYAPLAATQMAAFKVELVPVLVKGAAPKAGAAEAAALEQRLRALFPASQLELSYAPPLALDYVVDADGAGWDDALDALGRARSDAKPADDVFYYGMMAPGSSMDDYCRNGCQTGYANLAAPEEVEYRYGLGIGVFPDGSNAAEAWDTAAHELGHALGRDHSPCGIDDPDDADADYPYPASATKNLGPTYGFDFDLNRLVKPRQFRDVMGYCAPVWMSDYTYAGLFERLLYVQGNAVQTLGLEPPRVYRVARVDRRGHARWLGEARRGRSSRQPVPVALLDAAGQKLGSVSALVVRVDHAAGGSVWLPVAALGQKGAAAVDLSVLGGGRLAL